MPHDGEWTPYMRPRPMISQSSPPKLLNPLRRHCITSQIPRQPPKTHTQAMQLRPSMAHLDVEREGGKKAAPKEEEGPDAGVLMPVMVQVKKRETEAQLEARLRSFAHITAQEAAEEWVGLQYHDDMSEVIRAWPVGGVSSASWRCGTNEGPPFMSPGGVAGMLSSAPGC